MFEILLFGTPLAIGIFGLFLISSGAKSKKYRGHNAFWVSLKISIGAIFAVLGFVFLGIFILLANISVTSLCC